MLQENPYRLADDISGVGFKIADTIASRIGIHADSDYRIRSGMMYTLLQASGEGHVYLPKDELFDRASQLLQVDVSYMEKHLMDMAIDRNVVLKENDREVLVYPSQYYRLELNTARMLTELNIRYPQNEQMMERRIAQIEKETGTVLEEMQKKAVVEAAGNGLLYLQEDQVPVKLPRSMQLFVFRGRRRNSSSGSTYRTRSQANDRSYRL